MSILKSENHEIRDEDKRDEMSFQTKCSSIRDDWSVGNEEEGREGVKNLNR